VWQCQGKEDGTKHQPKVHRYPSKKKGVTKDGCVLSVPGFPSEKETEGGERNHKDRKRQKKLSTLNQGGEREPSPPSP